MSEWREQEWRIPRKEEVVKDPDGKLGRVTHTEGTLMKRRLWVENHNGTEMYSGEDAELFQVADLHTTSDFHHLRYNLKGYRVGSLCSYKGDPRIPLEILQMDWSNLRHKMSFCLKDSREFQGEVMLTDDDKLILPFDESSFPSREGIFSNSDSGLKWRLQINLVESSRDSWTNCGSPWEFFSKDDALKEVENWKARLMIRRVASVLNNEWKIEFPCWTVEAKMIDGKILTRAVEVKHANGSPGYFKTALLAAHASKIISPEEWMKALSPSQDIMNY
jgi:hypothetical protein